jgi:hypothetical protein
MRIKDVDFPTALLEAQQHGSLVVFAGAGVSMPPPSNYPNFDSLAEQVVGGALVREQYGDQRELVDHFLGRAKDIGVQVHDRVRHILSDSGSAPNLLHTTLLRLFKSCSDVRLVTTNFDLHFMTAAKAIFSTVDDLEIYYAPALPVGNSFAGIVHLHGSVGKQADRMVVTDSDFGAAYLTEGWAARFLQRLFAHNVVMFIGYSHSDLVIDYLARGLPPKSPGRFALAPVGTEAHWKRLGITPVTYPLGIDKQEHAALAPALQGWVNLIWTPALDHEEKVKAIVGRPVTLDPEEADYLLERVCKEIYLAQFFTRHAKTPDWLRWAENKGLLANLFNQAPSFGEIDQMFAVWFAQDFACKHPGDALAVLRRQGGVIGPSLWYQIALSFHQLNPPHEVVAQWIPLLANSQPPRGSNDLLEYRLCACEFPQDEASILLLFEHLTRPRIRLSKSVLTTSEDSEDVDIELTAEGSDYWLRYAWAKLLQPNLEALADKLLLVATSHIQHAYMLLRSFGKDRPNWDPLSGLRQQIEFAGQGSVPDAVGLLIDIARDVLQWTIAHRPTRADFFMNVWFSSGCRLLKRFAIFGVAESVHWEPDRKMNWLLEKDLLHVYSYKPEVFLVLQKGYANASEDVRTKILERALKGSDVLEERTKEYEVYNLVLWLAQTAPDCLITKQRLDEFVTAHPDFQPREHPNLNWWVGPGGFVSPVSPLGTDEILSSTPEKLLADLAAAERDEFIGPSREGLLRGVSEAVARQHKWSLDLVQKLKVTEFWESDLWKAIVNGWTQADLTEGQWTEVLTILLDTAQITAAVAYEGTHLLESGIAKTSYAIPIVCFPLSLRVSEKFWIACVASADGSTNEGEDWLSIAINRPAGTLVTFWLKMLSRLREQEGKPWAGIPIEYKRLFLAVLDGHSYAARVGRVLIAAHLFFLFGLERDWAVENIIPLFNFSEEPRRAIQAWHGYLGWGRWSEELLTYLMPRFEEAFPRLHSDFAREQRKRFCEYLAGIACHSSINPIQDGWLNRFILSVKEEERATWASYVREMLKGMKEPAVESAWNNWIKSYWQNRIDGLPVLLGVSEASAMVDWAVCFKDAFPDVAENVYRSPVPKREHFFLFEELSESDLLTRHPGAVARFVFYLLRNRVAPLYYFDPILKVVDGLRPFPEARNDLVQICQQLAELGYPAAGALKNLILGGTQEGPASPTSSG